MLMKTLGWQSQKADFQTHMGGFLAFFSAAEGRRVCVQMKSQVPVAEAGNTALKLGSHVRFMSFYSQNTACVTHTATETTPPVFAPSSKPLQATG